MMKKIKKNGFTVIELMVVVSIIGLLASVIVSSLNDARDKSKNTAINTEANSWINAIELYRSEVGELPLVGADGIACLGGVGIDNTCAGSSDNTDFKNLLSTYITSSKNPNRTPILHSGIEEIAYYIYSDTTGNGYVHWFLKGDTECIKGATPSFDAQNTRCVLLLKK